MELHHQKFLNAGFNQIIGVGIGLPKHAKHICRRKAPSLTCLTDETTATHRLYGLQQGTLGQFMNPSMAVAAVRAVLIRGHLQGQSTGDTKMLPGTFVVDTNGHIQFAYYSKHPGDHPHINQLLETL